MRVCVFAFAYVDLVSFKMNCSRRDHEAKMLIVCYRTTYD